MPRDPGPERISLRRGRRVKWWVEVMLGLWRPASPSPGTPLSAMHHPGPPPPPPPSAPPVADGPFPGGGVVGGGGWGGSGGQVPMLDRCQASVLVRRQ